MLTPTLKIVPDDDGDSKQLLPIYDKPMVYSRQASYCVVRPDSVLHGCVPVPCLVDAGDS